MNQFEEDLHENKDGFHWLHDAEFRKKYRVTKKMLNKRTAAIEKIDVFAEGARGPKQVPAKH